MLTLLATFGSLIINADEYLALRASDLNACAFGADEAFPIVGLADVHSALRILRDFTDVQYTGMVVIGHVKAGDLQSKRADEVKELLPLFHSVGFQRGECFKGAAALTGHLAPYAHIGTAVVVDGNAGKVFAVLITLCAFGVRPRHMGKAKRVNDLLGSMYF